MSERYPTTKVYDKFGLYAQELGDIRRLAAQYNHQREMEDYLTFWMQQDQLRGILRIDHTSTLRGAPEAYQEFQTQNYMWKIQAEIDESLLQATRAEVNLGKKFLAQHGIQRDMIGSWGNASGNIYAALPRDPQLLLPTHSVPVRNGLDSGYVSATITPSKPPVGQETEIVLATGSRIGSQTGQVMEMRGNARSTDRKKLELHKNPAPVKTQRLRQRNSPRPRSTSPSLADDLSAAGSSGRSRRNIRQTARYNEAIAELKLRGSGGEEDSDYQVSDERDEDSVQPQPHTPLPRLRITPDNRIIKVPALSSTLVINPESSSRTAEMRSGKLQIPPSVARGLPTTLKKSASPLPLQRIIVRPPRTINKPKRSSCIQQPAAGPVMNGFNQSLLGVPRQGLNFEKAMLMASERDAANATPWLHVQPKDFAEPTLTSMADRRRRSATLTAPAFSPIAERFQDISNQEHSTGKAVVYSPSEVVRSEGADLSTEETVMKTSLPARPEFPSTPSSKPRSLARNDRSIVLETGSPVPTRRVIPPRSTKDRVISNSQDGATTGHKKTGDAPCRVTKTPKPALGNASRRLDPVTGNVIIDQSMQQDLTPAASSDKQPPHASSSHLVHVQTTRQAAREEAKLAVAGLKNAATEVTKTKLPVTKSIQLPQDVEPAAPKSRSRTPKSAKTPSSQDLKERRKYSKSEAQRQKEARKGGEERREREARLALRAQEAESKRAERVAREAKAGK